MKNTFYDYCVVGGGPSGLTVAYKLLKAGKKVLMIERDSRIGGLAKSFLAVADSTISVAFRNSRYG